jgi:hypothetical protein
VVQCQIASKGKRAQDADIDMSLSMNEVLIKLSFYHQQIGWFGAMGGPKQAGITSYSESDRSLKRFLSNAL